MIVQQFLQIQLKTKLDLIHCDFFMSITQLFGKEQDTVSNIV